MKRELMMTVMQQMPLYLDNAQLKQLRQVMEKTLFYIIINAQTVSEYFSKNIVRNGEISMGQIANQAALELLHKAKEKMKARQERKKEAKRAKAQNKK